MPGWHKAAKKWIDEKKFVIVGVVQEQHPERCALFAQWQKFDWPILHDPINLLGNSAVPVTIAIRRIWCGQKHSPQSKNV